MKRETATETLAQITARYREHNDRLEASLNGERLRIRAADMAEVAERLRKHFREPK